MRKILDRETRSTKGNQYSDISERNYEFLFVRQENVNGQGTYMLRLIPKRKQTGLLNGFVWVDQKTFRIWRIEGTPARTPSWWIKRLYITLQFAEVKGNVAAYVSEGHGIRTFLWQVRSNRPRRPRTNRCRKYIALAVPILFATCTLINGLSEDTRNPFAPGGRRCKIFSTRRHTHIALIRRENSLALRYEISSSRFWLPMPGW